MTDESNKEDESRKEREPLVFALPLSYQLHSLLTTAARSGDVIDIAIAIEKVRQSLKELSVAASADDLLALEEAVEICVDALHAAGSLAKSKYAAAALGGVFATYAVSVAEQNFAQFLGLLVAVALWSWCMIAGVAPDEKERAFRLQTALLSLRVSSLSKPTSSVSEGTDEERAGWQAMWPNHPAVAEPHDTAKRARRREKSHVDE